MLGKDWCPTYGFDQEIHSDGFLRPNVPVQRRRAGSCLGTLCMTVRCNRLLAAGTRHFLICAREVKREVHIACRVMCDPKSLSQIELDNLVPRFGGFEDQRSDASTLSVLD